MQKFRRPAVEVTAVQLTDEVARSINLPPDEAHYHVWYKDYRQRFVSAQTLAEEGFESVGGKSANGMAKKPAKPRKPRERKALGRGLEEEPRAQVGVTNGAQESAVAEGA